MKLNFHKLKLKFEIKINTSVYLYVKKNKFVFDFKFILFAIKFFKNLKLLINNKKKSNEYGKEKTKIFLNKTLIKIK